MLGWILGLWSELVYLLKYKTYNEPENKYNVFPEDADKIVIMLHGMNGAPSQFKFHVEELERRDPQIKFFIPFILNRGMASPEECGDLILSQIKVKPNMKIVIVGISNGGRIGMYLYSKFAEHGIDLYLTTLGSPIKGTMTADLMIKTKLYWLSNYKWEILSQLGFNSETNQNLIKACEQIEGFNEKTLFYVSRNDMIIYPYNCGFLEGHEYKLKDGFGHNSLVHGVYSEQVDWIVQKL